MVDVARIGRRVRELREARLLSRARLAQRAGVSEPTIARLELATTERPHLRTIEKLAATLGVTPEAILLGEEQSPFVEAPLWARAEGEFLAWLTNAEYADIERMRVEVGALLGDYQERYGPSRTHKGFPTLEAAKAHAVSSEGRRGQLLHRRVSQLDRWLDYLDERARLREAALQEIAQVS